MAMIPLTWILTTSELAALTNATLSQNPTLDPFRTHTLPRTAEDSEVAQVEIIIMPNKVSATPPTPGKTYLSLFAINLHPLSRGSVHIASSNPLSPPVIDPRYYSEPVDKAIMLAAMKFAEKITQQEPLKGFIKERADVAEPGDEGLWDLIMRTTDSAKHPLGTCALGEKNKGGVVDGSLRIYGVQGLRVVDASVIPLQISTHTQATVYGIAERAAEIILGERGGRYR